MLPSVHPFVCLSVFLIQLQCKVLPRVRCYSHVTPRGSLTSPGPSTTTRPSSENEQDKRSLRWKQSGSSIGGLSESGSLRLNTTSAESTGTYTCTVSYAEETDVTNIELKILEDHNEAPQVDCVFGGSCLLPCRFQPNSNTVLHWVKKNGEDVNVHSYYEDQDQLEYQDPLYKGRTSLFPDQISGGNASLRLARVDLQDQGTYMFYVKDSPDQYVTLTVRALGSALTQTVVLLMGVVVGQEAPQVDCVFGGSCLLPCRFQPNGNIVLHWKKKDVQVHSYYEDQDQLGLQDPLYKGRTSLFPDQISGGNASLRLARVNLQDHGRYMCYARGNSPDKYVNLTVRGELKSSFNRMSSDTKIKIISKN
ncbi:HERV-H LTR-associating protein 2 [Merluccius polli]|uniref:HERV-H LTR-associating protein 2 n=1 Tax=Merluccius polli TaxID=89951 RepID=A0AA47MI74_MERPO|nr:HERV-H LTR-associating protein 2 [Merluccius polli]